MKAHNVDMMRALIDGTRGAKTLVDGERADLLADLRAEAFWNERAPVLNDELLALRPLEAFARAIANGGRLSVERKRDLGNALAALDAMRAGSSPKEADDAAR